MPPRLSAVHLDPHWQDVDFGTPGLRIQVSLVQNAAVLDRSQETFTVPEDGLTYYVDDASNTGDEYTPGATGSNRNTGKTADAPKPNPWNLFNTYELQAGAVLSIDTGEYPMIHSLMLSGSTDRGLGLDEGFTMTGPTGESATATLFPAVSTDLGWALIDLNDADFVSIRNVDLRNAQRGIHVQNGSDELDLDRIEAWGHSNEGIRVSSSAPLQIWDDISVHNNSGTGLYIDGSLGGLAHILSYSNTGYGLSMTGTLGSLTQSEFHHNTSIGASFSYAGDAIIQANSFHDNSSTGLYVVSSGSALIGSTDLSLGLGNVAYSNDYGIMTNGSDVLVAGNTVWDNDYDGINIYSGGASANVVHGNRRGIYVYNGEASYNRVYMNDTQGIYGYHSTITGNVVYNNATGLYLYSSNSEARNNLVYANTDAGVVMYGGNNGRFIGNTVYQTAGNAVTVQGGADNTTLIDNILWATTGFDISVASDSQDGFTSNFNIFQGTVGQWQGITKTSILAWRNAAFTDKDSLHTDPLFVDIDGGDDVLGYVNPSQDGRDDDFHLMSTSGSFHGGSLAPVEGASGHLPVWLTPVVQADSVSSPGIDRGSLDQPYANESAPNGGVVNTGAYGNTAQASLSPEQFVLVTSPNGGETLLQGESYDILWRGFGFTGT
jgi:parallel beta-helix repeat protein